MRRLQGGWDFGFDLRDQPCASLVAVTASFGLGEPAADGYAASSLSTRIDFTAPTLAYRSKSERGEASHVAAGFARVRTRPVAWGRRPPGDNRRTGRFNGGGGAVPRSRRAHQLFARPITALPSCHASTLISARACASRSTCLKPGRSIVLTNNEGGSGIATTASLLRQGRSVLDAIESRRLSCASKPSIFSISQCRR